MTRSCVTAFRRRERGLELAGDLGVPGARPDEARVIAAPFGQAGRERAIRLDRGRTEDEG